MNVCMCMLSCETLPAERLIHLGLGLLRAAPGELCARQGLGLRRWSRRPKGWRGAKRPSARSRAMRCGSRRARASGFVDAEHLERLEDGAAVRHGRRAYRAAMGHPRREQAAREPRLVRHAADASKPPELPASDVELDGVQPQPLSQLLGRDMMLPRLAARSSCATPGTLLVSDGHACSAAAGTAPRSNSTSRSRKRTVERTIAS